ncbi:bcl-2-like protein 13 isoform X3 [Dermochelys coriacea]|uniref:bcl-2-like protein 13 isoform X3 n=1 Tax=Dermochelys coriacea TaxID=27794 RepID=UPI001CA9D956|nr:bcl-2-like protein 13 isoform X3 [Dermochelys coriacea]
MPFRSPPHHGGVCNLGQLGAPRARTGWRKRRATAAAASRDSGPQQSVIPQALEKEVLEKLKTEIEEELKHLDEEILEAFTSTGFDCHTSPVFSPANPESSIEDCLAHLGEKVSQELKEPLHKALRILLSKPVTYQEYRERTLETDVHASGWSKGTVFSLDSEEEEYHAIAEDSNDIYILTSENSGQVSPPESPTVTTSWQSESLPVSLSASQSWHTESLPVSLGPESWQQVAMDPEEVKSLDSNGGGEERSENNSSNSDIVHVEKEEIPEGIEEAAVSSVALETETAQEGFLESPSLLEMKSEAEIVAVEKAIPSAPLLTEHEEKGEVAEEPVEPEIPMLSKPVQKPSPSEEKSAPEPEKILPPEVEIKVGKESHSKEMEEKSPAGEEKPILLPEGKSILLYGGAAAVAILAVAVGVALALRKK